MKDRRQRAAGIALITGMTALTLSTPAWGAAGELDLTFDVDGKVTTAVGPDYEYLYDVAVQADGKIVVVGTTLVGGNLDFAVLRYHTDGSLDATFGTAGVATVTFGPSDDFASAVALRSDGKIVVAGKGSNDFALARLDSDGTLDTTFGGDGTVTTAMSSPNGATAVALQPDGKVVAVGGGGGVFAVARYNADGTLDATFDGDGKVSTPLSSGIGQAEAVTLQSDGKVVVAGTATVADQVDFALARYLSDGTLDTSFDGDGKLTTAVATAGSKSDTPGDVAMQSDGRIVVVGYACGSDCDFAVARYHPDGSLDTAFAGDGTATTDVGGDDDFAFGLAVQPDGKIVAAGHSWGATYYDFAVVRYVPEGDLDASFDGDGKVTTEIGPSTDLGKAVALQADGKLVVAGYAHSGTSYDFALTRYLGDPFPVCGTTPRADCRTAVSGKGLLVLKDGAPDTKDALRWKWIGGSTPLADYGDPVNTDSYELCIYDGGGLTATMSAAPGGVCAGRPCWQAKTTSFIYRNKELTPDGLRKIRLKEGVLSRRAQIVIRGDGGNLAMPPLGALSSPIIVQLLNSGGICWQATYSSPFLKDDAGTLRDRGD